MTSAPDPIDPDGLLDGIRWPAVGLGVLVDVLVTFAANVPLLALFAPESLAEEPAKADQAMEQAYASPDFLIASLLVGLAATVCGAYVGARRAGAHHLRHGGWIAVASLLLGLVPVLLFDLEPRPPLWYEALGIVLMLPAGLLGGHIARAGSGSAG